MKMKINVYFHIWALCGPKDIGSQSDSGLWSCAHDGFKKWQPANHRAVWKHDVVKDNLCVCSRQRLPVVMYFWVAWSCQPVAEMALNTWRIMVSKIFCVQAQKGGVMGQLSGAEAPLELRAVAPVTSYLGLKRPLHHSQYILIILDICLVLLLSSIKK